MKSIPKKTKKQKNINHNIDELIEYWMLGSQFDTWLPTNILHEELKVKNMLLTFQNCGLKHQQVYEQIHI